MANAALDEPTADVPHRRASSTGVVDPSETSPACSNRSVRPFLDEGDLARWRLGPGRARFHCGECRSQLHSGPQTMQRVFCVGRRARRRGDRPVDVGTADLPARRAWNRWRMLSTRPPPDRRLPTPSRRQQRGEGGSTVDSLGSRSPPSRVRHRDFPRLCFQSSASG